MRKKLFNYFFAVSLIAVIITGFISFIAMRSSVVEEAKISAQAMAKMVIQSIKESDSLEYDEAVKALGNSISYKDHTPYRITIIGDDGKVLGDSSADILSMDNHLDRPEVIEARKVGVGSSRRDSDTLDINMLYVAVYDKDMGITSRIALPLIELKRISYNLIIGLVISISAGMVISVIASLIFAERLSQPINELAQASYEFAGGNLNKRVELKTSTELDDLSSAFNTMAEKLKNSLTEIKQKNTEFNSVLSSMHDGLIAVGPDRKMLYMNSKAKALFCFEGDCRKDDVELSFVVYQESILNAVDECLETKHTHYIDVKLGTKTSADYRVSVHPMEYDDKTWGAIIVMNDITRTLELEQLRSDFVANVSHELRTPLTSIKGYAETLKEDGVYDTKTAKRFLDIIEIEAERLNVLINDLMDLSKIENKSEDINISSHNLKKILDETIQLVSLSASKKEVEILKTIPDSLTVYVNRDRMKQLLLNLIDNGIKYNKDGGKLEVRVSAQKQMLEIIVKDTGEGIDKKDIPRLFERFYRVDKSRSKELGGTGLGLSIVKHIAELYNGSVTVTSVKGEGSEFIVKMPIVKV